VPQAVANVILGISALQLAGAEHFLVAQLPNTGRSFDLWPEQAAEATALTLSFNSLLASALDALVGIDFTLFDVFSLIEGIASIRAGIWIGRGHHPLSGDSGLRGRSEPGFDREYFPALP
jgi:hypothetical protein